MVDHPQHGWNSFDFPQLTKIMFEEYHDWLGRNTDKYWDKASERLYFIGKIMPLQDSILIHNPHPRRESEFELPLVPYYKKDKEHRLVRCIKRKETRMIIESNKRRRI